MFYGISHSFNFEVANSVHKMKMIKIFENYWKLDFVYIVHYSGLYTDALYLLYTMEVPLDFFLLNIVNT